eukprot:3070178-Rhodomonas_salina.2
MSGPHFGSAAPQRTLAARSSSTLRSSCGSSFPMVLRMRYTMSSTDDFYTTTSDISCPKPRTWTVARDEVAATLCCYANGGVGRARDGSAWDEDGHGHAARVRAGSF